MAQATEADPRPRGRRARKLQSNDVPLHEKKEIEAPVHETFVAPAIAALNNQSPLAYINAATDLVNEVVSTGGTIPKYSSILEALQRARQV